MDGNAGTASGTLEQKVERRMWVFPSVQKLRACYRDQLETHALRAIDVSLVNINSEQYLWLFVLEKFGSHLYVRGESLAPEEFGVVHLDKIVKLDQTRYAPVTIYTLVPSSRSVG